jgi:glycosyltransferase involved in cell wall biosynthesis
VKLAFIVQRYGAEILGGSEYHCRLIAERLAARHDVDVLTTCARDYITWENEYPEGPDRIRGVTVRRFKNARTRDIASFNQYSDWIFHHPHTRDDALIFFTYLYSPTVLGLAIDPARSILVPTAHNEPAIHLSIYREMFAKAAAVAFNTEVEKNFLKTTFQFRAVAEETVGCGVDLMQDQSQADEPEPEDEEELHKRLPAHLRARGAQFRRRHRLQGQFLLYGGRIDAGKGCEELIEYFTSYKEQGGDAQLALMGVKLMQLPEVPWVRFAGLLSERERLQALEAATVVVVPSPFESLSLLALEAMAVGTPVLCNARAEVLVEHCLKSNAGLFYSDRDEFVECTKLLLADDRLRDRMGRNGKEYIKRNYRWDVIMSKYDRLIGALKR